MTLLSCADRTFHRLIRSPRNSEVANNSLNSIAFASDSTTIAFASDLANSVDCDSNIANSDSDFSICISKLSLDNMDDNNRTLKELTTYDIIYQPWCIRHPELEQFHGLASEDPHKHLKEFHVVCSTMRPRGIPKDYIKMKTFPFSLDGVAKNWLYLQPTLHEEDFLGKILPSSIIASIKKEICSIKQHMVRHYMSTRRDSTSYVKLVLITKSMNNC
ncbi:hypothetical protein CR513_31944, partial [Mucuna pruriens]